MVGSQGPRLCYVDLHLELVHAVEEVGVVALDVAGQRILTALPSESAWFYSANHSHAKRSTSQSSLRMPMRLWPKSFAIAGGEEMSQSEGLPAASTRSAPAEPCSPTLSALAVHSTATART